VEHNKYIKVFHDFRTTGVTGSVKVNGRERNVQKFRKKLCYITQEFAILELLTTRETMVIAAELKLNADVGKLKKNEMVRRVSDYEISRCLPLVKHVSGLNKVIQVYSVLCSTDTIAIVTPFIKLCLF
jgi:ABC-type multidrug transport system ATPase subunit